MIMLTLQIGYRKNHNQTWEERQSGLRGPNQNWKVPISTSDDLRIRIAKCCDMHRVCEFFPSLNLQNWPLGIHMRVKSVFKES